MRETRETCPELRWRLPALLAVKAEICEGSQRGRPKLRGHPGAACLAAASACSRVPLAACRHACGAPLHGCVQAGKALLLEPCLTTGSNAGKPLGGWVTYNQGHSL